MKLFSRFLLVALALSAARVFAINDPPTPPCVDTPSYGPFFCLQEGNLASGYALSPTNLSVKMGESIVYNSKTSDLQIVNALQSRLVTHSCPDIPNNYQTTASSYTFGDIYFDPPLPGVIWSPGTYTYEAQVVATSYGSACPPILCDLGPITVTVESNSDVYINVDFGNGTGNKTGFAAVGGSSNDVWNAYGSLEEVVTNTALTNLLTGNGLVSPVDLLVLDSLNFGTNGSPDPMYNDYLSADYDGATLILTNLPVGAWDLYLYSSDGQFNVTVGANDYGIKSTFDSPLSNPLVWQEGVQYAKFSGLNIYSNEVVTINMLRGQNGLAMISGLQIATVRSNSPGPLASALVGWWRGDGNTADSAGTNNGVPIGIGYAWGQVGPAFVFNGTNSCIQVSNSPSLQPTGPFALEAWVNYDRITGTNGDTVIMKGLDLGTPVDWAVSISSGQKLRPEVNVNGSRVYFDCNTTLQPSYWYHVAMVYDGATLRGFVNGVLDGVQPASGAVHASENGIKIGARAAQTNSVADLFAGRIDEISFYNRALTDAEVQSTYNAGSKPPPILPSGLVAWWKADGNAADSAGLNDGTTPYGIAYASGKVGQAFDFNGSMRRVSIADRPAFKLTNSLTIEGWIYPRQYNTGFICFRGDNRPGLDPWTLDMYVEGYIDFQIDGSANDYVRILAPIQTNRWQHVAATLDGATGDLKLYVDGIVKAQTNTTVRPIGDLDPGSEEPAIGIGNHGGTYHQFPFNGLIDELSLYSRALTPGEILAIYNSGSSGKYCDSDYDGVGDTVELTERTDPFDSNSVLHKRLAYLRFNDTNTWMGESCQMPVSASNVVSTVSWSGSAALFNSNSPTLLRYSDVEPWGQANINYREGTIRFWYKPDWESGAGPGSSGATLFSTVPSTNSPGSSWVISINGDGNTLVVTATTQDPGAITSISGRNIGFGSNTWHQVAVAYSSNNVSLYIDGVWKTSGSGPLFVPPLDVRRQGFLIGSDSVGGSQAKGAFDEFETFNYVISSNDIVTQYASTAAIDANGNGLPDIWEWNHFGNFAQRSADDPDGDGLNNLQENLLGTDPMNPDTDYDGRSDGQEFNDVLNPLDPDSVLPVRLSVWHFDDTNSWAADRGQVPSVASNIQGTTNWSGTALLINNSSNALLKYYDVETNGLANINCRSGSVRFWFAPDWISGNAGGSGPGGIATFISLGDGWNFTAGPLGNQLFFNSGGSTLLTAPFIAWKAHEWHQLCLTYAPTGSVLYVDGSFLVSGAGVQGYPNAKSRFTNGLNVGSDPAGGSQAKGQIDELETFNYPVDSSTISNDYAAAFLAAPSATITDFGADFSLQIALQQLLADQIISPISGFSYPNTVTLSVSNDYADAFVARALHHYDSSSIGVNVTQLPAPIIMLDGGEFSSISNITISLGAENLTNMVEGIYKTELGRACNQSELDSSLSYVFGLRGNGLTDEGIRSDMINVLRVSQEYTNIFHTGGDVYAANTNSILEYSLDGGDTWIIYTGPVQITQSATLQARFRKLGTQDRRTTYTYLTSARAQSAFVYNNAQLGYWPFDNTNWLGAQGQLPLTNFGLNFSLVTGVESNAVDLSGADRSQILGYRYVETNGHPNIQPQQGTVRFWFSPGWSSVSQGGAGLPDWGLLISFGSWSASATNGAWQIALDSTGDQVGIRVQDSTGNSIEPLYAQIPGGWTTNQWRQIVVTYSPTGTAIFVDGVLAGSGGGLNGIMPPQFVLNQGFYIGSDSSGTEKSFGAFDLLETFNYLLNPAQIQQDYASQSAGIAGENLMGGFEQNRLLGPLDPIITIEHPANGEKIY